MKNPKLIDEAWIDEQIQYVGTPNNKYDDALLHVMNLVKSKLQPLPNPTKTNVDKIRAGEMAIENDDKEAIIKCCVSLFEDGVIATTNYKYYFAWEKDLNMWDACTSTTLPTIKASELIKEIEGVSEPEPEWQPKFGDKITVNDCGIMKDGVCVAIIEGIVYWLTESEFNELESGRRNVKYVKPRTPTLTLAEAESKLGVKIIT